MSRRGAIAFLATSLLVALGMTTGQAVASHAGAIVDCGTAGTFTVSAAENRAGFQSPFPTSVIVFQEGGVLTVQSVARDGQLLFTRADNGRQRNSLTEVTCSFATGSDGVFTVTGILTG
jgi:ethanolamine ammonia-lyase small subunit